MERSWSPAQFVIAGIIAALAAALVIGTRSSGVAGDIDAYWQAAERLRDGGHLYLSNPNVGAPEVYRYAPWYAAAWVPLTYLPRVAVETAWIILLLGAAVSSLSRAPLLAAAAVAPLLTWSALLGNVHPLLIAALMLGHRRRSAPVWVALAASLKIFPIIYVAVFLGRRQWRAAAMALALFVLLWSPVLLLDLGTYPVTPGGTLSALSLFGPAPYAALAAVLVLIAIWRATWFTGSVAVLIALPRLLLYDFSYLLVGAGDREAAG